MPEAAHPVRQLTLRHLEQLTAHLLDGVILMDAAGTIVRANAAALRMHGMGTQEDLGSTVEGYAERFALWSEDHRPLKQREYPLARLLAGESFPDLVVQVAPAGQEETRWVHQVRDVVMDVDGGEPDWLALVLSDVSERFDAEVRFKAMFQANPAPALIVRLGDQRIIRANPGFIDLTGFDPDHLVGRTLFGLDLLGDMADPGAVRKAVEAGEVVPQTEAELLHADGSRRLVLFAGQPIDVTEEDALLLTFADLEPRRRAEDERAAGERHLSAVFEMAPVAMMVTGGDDHRIATVNAAFRALTGHDDEEAVGRTAAELGLWNDDPAREAAEADVAAHGGFRDRDAGLARKEGLPVDCLVSAEAVRLHGAASTLWVLQDVTERRRGERELADAIEGVMKDASWLSRSILDKLATLRRPGLAAPAAELSPREREMLELICNDLDDAAIAERLRLSRNTVRNHVARLYAKIGVNRRSAAVIWGRERGVGDRRS